MQIGTRIKIIDNSGAMLGRCIKVYKKGIVTVGDLIMLSVKRVKRKKFMFKSSKSIGFGSLFKGLVVRSKCNFFFLGGHFGRCFSNAVILIKKDNVELVGTRVDGPVSSFLKFKGFLKVLSLSRNVF